MHLLDRECGATAMVVAAPSLERGASWSTWSSEGVRRKTGLWSARTNTQKIAVVRSRPMSLGVPSQKGTIGNDRTDRIEHGLVRARARADWAPSRRRDVACTPTKCPPSARPLSHYHSVGEGSRV
jgi:hypothetical protein